MGKRTMGESGSDDTDEDGSDNNLAENEKSVVIDNGNHSDSSKELEGVSDANSTKQLDVSCSVGLSESSSEEEKDLMNGGSSEISGSPSGSKKDILRNGLSELDETHKMDMVVNISGSEDQEIPSSVSDIEKEDCAEPIVCQPLNNTLSQKLVGSQSAPDVHDDGNETTGHNSAVGLETAIVSTDIQEVEHRPISLEDISSAAELEVFGMDKLKSELQALGLKCGGTLQERAARLFLLKTTPVDKIPKKLLAKK